MHNFIYIKHPGRANPQRRKEDVWLPGVGVVSMGSFQDDENVLKLTEVMVAQLRE